MNKVIITGRLGANPVEHDGENGKFVSYTLANTEWHKNGETTNWIDVLAFAASAEFAMKNLVNGQKIILEGRLTSRITEKDGVKRKSTTVIAVRQELDEKKRAESNSDEVMEITPEMIDEFCQDGPF